MPNRTQEKLYETFVSISGGRPSSLDPMIDASEELSGAAAKIAKAMDRVAASKADPVYGGGTPPATSMLSAWLVDRGAAEAARTIARESDSPVAPNARGTVAPLSERPITVQRPAAETAGPTVQRPAAETARPAAASTTSIASTLLHNVFGSMPLIGAIQGAQSGHSGGIGSTVESIASTVLKSGLGLVPLIGGLLGLFGGGDSTQPAPLVKYAMPPPIAFQGADTGSGIGFADSDQMGMPRAYGAATPTASAPPAPPQITVNVQAMDARSFLDRSSDIAAAVREAMLNLNSLNDVVSEL